MNKHVNVGFKALQQALESARVALPAAEVHGMLAGYLCGGGDTATGTWLERLQLEDADAALESVLDAAARQLVASLQAAEAAITPWLAATDELEACAHGLVAWCRGFLGGFGLAGTSDADLEPALKTILRDFADIAATEPDFDDPDEDREALQELIDHAVFAALLLHARVASPEDAGS